MPFFCLFFLFLLPFRFVTLGNAWILLLLQYCNIAILQNSCLRVYPRRAPKGLPFIRVVRSWRCEVAVSRARRGSGCARNAAFSAKHFRRAACWRGCCYGSAGCGSAACSPARWTAAPAGLWCRGRGDAVACCCPPDYTPRSLKCSICRPRSEDGRGATSRRPQTVTINERPRISVVVINACGGPRATPKQCVWCIATACTRSQPRAAAHHESCSHVIRPSE
jgi:hypothetical protein